MRRESGRRGRTASSSPYLAHPAKKRRCGPTQFRSEDLSNPDSVSLTRSDSRGDENEVVASPIVVIPSLLFSVCGAAQQLPADESAPLVLVRIIPIPGVVGRFDHMAVDNKGGRVFAAVYGNDSVEVLDTARGRLERSLKEGFIKPQMVAFLPGLNRIVVSSEGDGSCKILDAKTYQVVDTVKFSDDADQLRYDPVANRVYVGYGEGAIGVFDATTNKKLEDFDVGRTPNHSNSK